MNMELLPLISIPLIYFVVAIVKPYVQPRLPFGVCAICVAVSLTWLSMLVMWFFNFAISLVSLGILMGMSITGIMYKLEDLYKKKEMRNFWFVRLVVVVGGFYIVYQLLNEEWNYLSLILIISVIFVSIATLFFQGTTHGGVVVEQEKAGRESSLIKRLDDCC